MVYVTIHMHLQWVSAPHHILILLIWNEQNLLSMHLIYEKKDQVLLQLESAGGVVHGYGLAASQLQRLRDAEIPLTVAVDKVAASGGYMMAAVANHIIAAPFAIIGSICFP